MRPSIAAGRPREVRPHDADARAVARFRAEAEAQARLQHPSIVQIHHVGEAAGLVEALALASPAGC